MWDQTALMCKRISDPNCAKFTGGSCTECFYNSSKRTVISNYNYKALSSDNKVTGFGGVLNKTMTALMRTYYLSDFICCPEKTLNDGGFCVPITIAGCKEGKIVGNAQVCDVCLSSS